MKALRCMLVVVLAIAVSSAAPSGANEPKPTDRLDPERQRAVQEYFQGRAEAQGKASRDPTDPKWVRSMQQLFKELSDDNARLQVENERLRADNDALKRALSAMEAKLRQLQQNRGTLVIPPEQFKKAPPQGWKPFEFNGQTYYLIPLEQGQKGKE